MNELKYGSNTVHVEALIERWRNLTTEEVEALVAAYDAAWDEVWDAAWDAVVALVVRDFISEEHYGALTAPVAKVLGPLHPDDDVTR